MQTPRVTSLAHLGTRPRKWGAARDVSRRDARHSERDGEAESGSASEQWRQAMGPKKNRQKTGTARIRIDRRSTRVGEPLTVEQFGRLLHHRLIKTEPYRTMVLLAACTGLTASELSVLKWRDVDRENGKLYVRIPNAWAESTTVPLSPSLADVLIKWKRRSPFKLPDDLVFAGRGRAGKSALDSTCVERERLIQAGMDIGYGKVSGKPIEYLGWHTLRRSYATWLSAAGASPAVMMRLLRLVTPPRPLDDIARESPMREANSKVVDFLQRQDLLR